MLASGGVGKKRMIAYPTTPGKKTKREEDLEGTTPPKVGTGSSSLVKPELSEPMSGAKSEKKEFGAEGHQRRN